MKKILFVERDAYWMNAIGSQFMLKPEYQIEHVMTFAEGMNKLQQGFPYHAIVVSLNTIFQGEQEGMLISNIKSVNSAVQVIIILENNDPHKYVSFIQSGAHAVLSKPYSSDAICAEFEKMVNNSMAYQKPKEVAVGGLHDLGENTSPMHEFNPTPFSPNQERYNNTPVHNPNNPYNDPVPGYASQPGNYQPKEGYDPHPGNYQPKEGYEPHPGYAAPPSHIGYNPQRQPGYYPQQGQYAQPEHQPNQYPPQGYQPQTGQYPQQSPGVVRIRDKTLIVVNSPKGGVGKSTVSKELATTYAMSSFNGNKLKVCLVDMDIENGDIATMLDLKPTKTITEWADNIRNRPSSNGERVIYSYEEMEKYFLLEHSSGLKVLAAPVAHKDVSKINEDIVETIYENLKRHFDIIVVDTGPNIRDFTLISLEKADNMILVADTDVTTINEVLILRRTLEQMHYPMNKIGLVINNVPPKNQSALNDIVNFLRFPLIGSITRSAVIEDSNNKGSIMVMGKDTAFTIEIKKIANSIIPIIRRDASLKGSSKANSKRPKESKSIFSKIFKK